MKRRPPRSTRTDTLFPYTTLFRSIPDFETGDLLQMTGSAEILWPEAGGAEADGNLQVNCRVRFTPSGTVLRPRAMPGGWSLLGGAQAAGGPLPRRRGDG